MSVLNEEQKERFTALAAAEEQRLYALCYYMLHSR